MDILTPAKARSVEFTVVSKDGYSEREVDSFVGYVERSLLMYIDANDKLLRENRILKEQLANTNATADLTQVLNEKDVEIGNLKAAVEQLSSSLETAQITAVPAPHDADESAELRLRLEAALSELEALKAMPVEPPTTPPVEVMVSQTHSKAAVDILTHAQNTADATVADAESFAKNVKDEALEFADRVRVEAKDQSDTQLEQARVEAEALRVATENQIKEAKDEAATELEGLHAKISHVSGVETTMRSRVMELVETTSALLTDLSNSYVASPEEDEVVSSMQENTDVLEPDSQDVEETVEEDFVSNDDVTDVDFDGFSTTFGFAKEDE